MTQVASTLLSADYRTTLFTTARERTSSPNPRPARHWDRRTPQPYAVSRFLARTRRLSLAACRISPVNKCFYRDVTTAIADTLQCLQHSSGQRGDAQSKQETTPREQVSRTSRCVCVRQVRNGRDRASPWWSSARLETPGSIALHVPLRSEVSFGCRRMGQIE